MLAWAFRSNSRTRSLNSSEANFCSITSQIGPHFRRARMGVGHPGHKDRVMGHVLSDFHKADRDWVNALCNACAEALPLLLAGEDEKYQAEVMRLAPAGKLDPRQAARDAD